MNEQNLIQREPIMDRLLFSYAKYEVENMEESDLGFNDFIFFINLLF